MPIEVYCAHCGKTVARFRTIMSFTEIERKTLERCRHKCPNCGAKLEKLDLGRVKYEIKPRKTRRRSRRTLRARSRL